MTDRHKTFLSYYHDEDEIYREKFEKIFSDIYVSKSVEMGDIDPNLDVETVRNKIREEYLKDTSVTVVLVGAHTWQRKHVDWEISSSIRETKTKFRSGLLGIILPTHESYGKTGYNPYTTPPRLYDNIKCGFATIYDWNNNPKTVQEWIHQAFLRKDQINPDNSRDLFKNNHTGQRWD